MTKRRLALALAVFAAAAVALPSAAGAAILAEADSYGLRSTQLDGGAAFWLERSNEFRESSRHKSSRILRRNLGAAVPESIYETDADDRVTGFNATGGRVVVGTFNPYDGSSRIIEVKYSAGGVSTTVLAQLSGSYAGLMCQSRVRLIAVNAQLEAIVEELRQMSQDGNCSSRTLKRTESTISAIAIDGSARVLLERKTGWGLLSSDNLIGQLTWGHGDWFAQITTSDDSDFNPGSSGMLNLTTGQFAEAQVPVNYWRHFEVSAGGRVLSNQDGESTVLRSDPTFPDRSRTLSRSNTTRWMHFCGDKILEISRRGEPWPRYRSKRRAGKFWNLYILNADGVRERRLPQRLKRGTNFGACNAETAVFHFYLKNRTTRQFTVPLGSSPTPSPTPPGP